MLEINFLGFWKLIFWVLEAGFCVRFFFFLGILEADFLGILEIDFLDILEANFLGLGSYFFCVCLFFFGIFYANFLVLRLGFYVILVGFFLGFLVKFLCDCSGVLSGIFWVFFWIAVVKELAEMVRGRGRSLGEMV